MLNEIFEIYDHHQKNKLLNCSKKYKTSIIKNLLIFLHKHTFDVIFIFS